MSSVPSASSTSVARSQATAAPTTNYRLRSRRFRTSTRTIMEQTQHETRDQMQGLLCYCLVSYLQLRGERCRCRQETAGRDDTRPEHVPCQTTSRRRRIYQSSWCRDQAEHHEYVHVLANETGLNTCTCQHCGCPYQNNISRTSSKIPENSTKRSNVIHEIELTTEHT